MLEKENKNNFISFLHFVSFHFVSFRFISLSLSIPRSREQHKEEEEEVSKKKKKEKKGCLARRNQPA